MASADVETPHVPEVAALAVKTPLVGEQARRISFASDEDSTREDGSTLARPSDTESSRARTASELTRTESLVTATATDADVANADVGASANADVNPAADVAPPVVASSILAKHGADWALPPRYQWRKLIGTGSYGSVCEVVDRESQSDDGSERIVAIKRVFDVFADVDDGKRILRELAILRRLGEIGASRHIVQLLDVLQPADPTTFSDLYLVFEHCGQDLRKMSRRRAIILNDGQVRSMMKSLLLGLQELHAYGIYHRDLKPANCLVPLVPHGAPDSAWEIRICDFGHARVVSASADPEAAKIDEIGKEEGENDDLDELPQARLQRGLTCHVATRWYRAPELILLKSTYTAAVDVWSSGCILAELCGMQQDDANRGAEREPLLQGRSCFPLSPLAGDIEPNVADMQDQLGLIVTLLGSPSEEEIDEVCGGHPGDVVAEASKRYLRSFEGKEPVDPFARYTASSPAAKDLLSSMLRFSPLRRPTVNQALLHPFLHDDTAESTVQAPASIQVQLEPLSFENVAMNRSILRKLLLHEIQLMRANAV
eukprot:TRINITY_DN3231_c0_g1_i1.p1 TRINITY_DN3231_c0_g1~~TRINITY_DN3231_c0_g1_i1.p1  ORF type:complete len:561 (-),score=101.00 TRINITY_DN3231_c0_g1_i1:162-1793(-)